MSDNTFNVIFSTLHCGDCDPNLTGMDSSFILNHKHLFRRLWDQDFEEGMYKGAKAEERLALWLRDNISWATDITQDDKWELENYYHKFLVVYALRRVNI